MIQDDKTVKLEDIDYMRPFEFETVNEVEAWRWAGNHYMDHQAFRACTNLAKQYASSGHRETARKVVYLFGKYGMGLDDTEYPVTDEVLDQVLNGE